MLYKKTNWALAITLLLIAGSAGASTIPEKHVPEIEIKNFEDLMNNNHSDLFRTNRFYAALSAIIFGGQIDDPNKLALAGHIHNMLDAYKKCVECLRNAHPDREFSEWQEKFNNAKREIFKLDAPTPIKQQAHNMENALWNLRR